MTKLNSPANPGWPDVTRFEVVERLLGGDGGPLNRAPLELLERTEFLKKQLAEAVQPISPSLTAIANINTVGLYASTGTGTVAARKLTGGTGISVSNGDGVSGNPTISLGAGVVIPGVYAKVTVDTYGRTVGGGALVADDIPSLDWGKIVSGKPTTRAGYGITDSAAVGGDAAQQFNVADATQGKHAVNAGQIQAQGVTAFATAGTATAYTLTPSPAIQAYAPNLRFRAKFHVASGSNPTINISGQGAVNLKQYDAQGNKIAAILAAGQLADIEYDGADAVVLDPLPTPKMSVVGTMRNALMSVTAASASAMFSADEIVVESALGGTAYQLANFSKTINLATAGVGGMDTGSAPVSGFVALYAIYNTTTGTANILATNATSSVVGNIYGGANMPAGYTASALIGVWPTNSSGQFVVGYQIDRLISPAVLQVISAGAATSYTSLSIASAVPKNARSCEGYASLNGTGSGMAYIAASGTGLAEKIFAGNTSSSYGPAASFSNLPMITAQTLYYKQANGSVNIFISGYSF
ncbi:hypothetical protein JW897_17775 [Chromobacterium alkanivorans]|uniref:hypothetical protein n=1 Tax=Chromobacterium alkanivorans TaxID=1071719 RepID=UPI001967C5ED|nr:hypothetical protein [Chromobacterium alkanivorans]MBN3005585.1 hypothetical protein [Chromobacterium alkanivorans]